VKQFENEGSPIVEEMLRQIALLYQIEKAVRGRDAAVRLAARRDHSAPMIAALKPSLEAQISCIPQKSQRTEDIRYTLAHWPGLIRFLDDGALELDTNPVENQIRPIALTRKNALFAGNEVGAEHSAMLTSLVATCKMSDVNPADCIARTLRAILDGHPKAGIEELMPWSFAQPSSLTALGHAVALTAHEASRAHIKLSHSRTFLLRAYLLQTYEMLFDGPWHGFRVFGGVPGRGIYDNMRTAVDRAELPAVQRLR